MSENPNIEVQKEQNRIDLAKIQWIGGMILFGLFMVCVTTYECFLALAGKITKANILVSLLSNISVTVSWAIGVAGAGAVITCIRGAKKRHRLYAQKNSDDKNVE